MWQLAHNELLARDLGKIMKQKIQGLCKFWTTVTLLIIAHIAVFDLLIITSDDSLQVQYTPDDAYYYLALAKNFVNQGIWTFDSGQSLTSGFHLLWAYLLSAIYRITTPSSAVFVQYGLILSSVVTIISLLIAWKIGLQFEKPFYMLLLALIASSRNFTLNSVSVMEWPLIILISLLYCIQYRRSFFPGRTWQSAAVLFTLGFLGSLSRSDFGLLPIFLFAPSLLLFLLRKKNPNIPTFWGAIGAAGGALLTLFHNYLFTGEYLQSSAKMKIYWRQIYGNNYSGVITLLRSILGLDSINLTLFSVIITVSASLFVIGLLISVVRQRKQVIIYLGHNLHQWSLFIAATLCVAGYGLFYLSNGAIQPWYSANLVVPLFLVLLAGSTLLEKYSNPLTTGLILSGLAAPIIIINSMSFYPLKTTNSVWPYQGAMLQAGKYLAQQGYDGLIGSWNAGIIGYYQGGEVVNLDGLVNNEIYEYAIQNDSPSYIMSKGIRYIVDFENVFQDQKVRQRVGINNHEFIDRLRPIIIFDHGEYNWKHLTLYECPPIY